MLISKLFSGTRRLVPDGLEVTHRHSVCRATWMVPDPAAPGAWGAAAPNTTKPNCRKMPVQMPRCRAPPLWSRAKECVYRGINDESSTLRGPATR